MDACVAGSWCKDGVCAPEGGLDAPCTFGQGCNAGFYCDSTRSACAAKKSVGAPCDLFSSDDECHVYCGAEGVCAEMQRRDMCDGA
jgi:hypothetical protein